MMGAMRGLLIIDIQNDYFPGGAFPLVGPEAAAEAARRALDAFRGSGEPIVHPQHVWDAPDVTVIHDGCAAPDLEFGGRQVDGASVHAAFMAALGDGYATLVGSGELPSR